MALDDPEVHLRMLTPDDAGWLVRLDEEGYDDLAQPFGWVEGKLAAELAEGIWASDEQVGWAVIVDGEPAGVAFARELTSGDGLLDIRLVHAARGRGVGREVLRQLADHHFADRPSLRRVEGRTHEDNVGMQRAFNAAGFRMEARYRDSFEERDGGMASEWGYALTRSDWEAGLHRADDDGYDLHGLTFTLDNDTAEPQQMQKGAVAKFLQEGRRVLIRYSGGHVAEGEGAGVIVDDSLRYRFVHTWKDHELVKGWGRSRVQRRKDGKLEIVDEYETDDGTTGKHVWLERQ